MVRIVECSDKKVIYGYVEVKGVSVEEVQDKINEIKNDEKFLSENPDWMIADVLAMLPKEWDVKFYVDDGKVIEI